MISPLLANLALDGLEIAVKAALARRGAKVNVVRYADDFIVTGRDERLLREEVLPVVQAFLEPRGLALSEEKTRICNIEQGFDFLGFNLRKYGGKLLIKPAPQKIRAFLGRICECVQSLFGAPVKALIRKLNSMLRGLRCTAGTWWPRRASTTSTKPCCARFVSGSSIGIRTRRPRGWNAVTSNLRVHAGCCAPPLPKQPVNV